MGNKLQSALEFTFMSMAFKVRDFIRPRAGILAKAGIKPGATVLDFGCGAGSYILPLAGIVGESGTIYAMDVNRLAIKSVENLVFKNGLNNVHTIRSGLKTGLPEASVDTILLHDVFHQLSRPDRVLAELARVLKPGGTLSVSDHHLKEEGIINGVTGTGKFGLENQSEKIYNFHGIS